MITAVLLALQDQLGLQELKVSKALQVLQDQLDLPGLRGRRVFRV